MLDRPLAPWSRYGLVALLALVTYLPSLGNGFTLDDADVVRDDERIRDLRAVPELLTQPYLTHVPAARSPYRPLTSVSYALSWSLGNGQPFGFHLTNVVLHVLACVLLLGVLTALGAPNQGATLGAAVFAVHPVHVEAVAGVVGRADVLVATWVLAALLLWLSEGVSKAGRVAGVALIYLLALASKESAVVLPALLVLSVVLKGGETAVRKAVVGTLPALAAMALSLVAFLGARRAVLGGVVQLDVASYIAMLSPTERATTAVANLGELLRLLVFPADLAPDYGPEVILPAGAGDVRFWGGVAILLGGLGLVVSGVRRPEGGRLWIAGCVAWIAIAYALLSNLLLPLPMWMAERTLYLASVGVALGVVGVVRAVQTEHPRLQPAVVASMLLLIVTGGVHAGRHSALWRDDTTLFTDFAERHPESFRAQWWVGSRFVDAGDTERGLEWLGRAHEANPNDALLALDYARTLLIAGRSTEAEAIVRPIPSFLHPSRSVYLAQSLIFQGRAAEAAEAVRDGLSHFPDDARLLGQARELGGGA